MTKLIKKSKMTGPSPETSHHGGKANTDKVKITVFDYDEENLSEKTVDNVEECFYCSSFVKPKISR